MGEFQRNSICQQPLQRLKLVDLSLLYHNQPGLFLQLHPHAFVNLQPKQDSCVNIGFHKQFRYKHSRKWKFTTKAMRSPAHLAKSGGNNGSEPNIVMHPMFSPSFGISSTVITHLTADGSESESTEMHFTLATGLVL